MSRLRELGVDVRASFLDRPTRRAVTLVDDAGERTITTFGPRLEPLGGDHGVVWDALDEIDAVYFTAGDEDALRAARAAARVLVASPRARHALGHGVPLDALVLSGDDEIELHAAGRRAGGSGAGRVHRGRARRQLPASAPAQTGRWAAAAPPGEPVDSYGCGDSFAAGLTYGLGAGLDVARRPRPRRPLRRGVPDGTRTLRAAAELSRPVAGEN